MVTTKAEKIFILSSNAGIGGHRVDGEPPANPSFAEGTECLVDMIGYFGNLPTGTRIRVTMEDVE